jgi:hypothetical protein
VSDFTVPGPGVGCPAAVGLASGGRPLDVAPGTYELAIVHLDTTDTYRVVVSDTLVQIDGVGRISAPAATSLWRFPPNSFAVRCGTMDDSIWICDDLRRMLLQMPGITPFVFPATAVSPYGGVSNGWWYNTEPDIYRYAPPAYYARVIAAINAFHDRELGRHAGTTFLVNKVSAADAHQVVAGGQKYWRSCHRCLGADGTAYGASSRTICGKHRCAIWRT